MDLSQLDKLGPLANSLGFGGLALLVILGLAYACRTLWKALQDEQAKGAKRDALILDQETEHQRLLVRFEEALTRLRETDERRRTAEERLHKLVEERLAEAEERRPPTRRTRRPREPA